MSSELYQIYRRVLLRNFFKSTGTGELRPNWTRTVKNRLDIERVFLYHDGTFRAYRGDGNPYCHGQSVSELVTCVG